MRYSRFQVTVRGAVRGFVLSIPNDIAKFGILRGNLLWQICYFAELNTEVPN